MQDLPGPQLIRLILGKADRLARLAVHVEHEAAVRIGIPGHIRHMLEQRRHALGRVQPALHHIPLLARQLPSILLTAIHVLHAGQGMAASLAILERDQRIELLALLPIVIERMERLGHMRMHRLSRPLEQCIEIKELHELVPLVGGDIVRRVDAHMRQRWLRRRRQALLRHIQIDIAAHDFIIIVEQLDAVIDIEHVPPGLRLVIASARHSHRLLADDEQIAGVPVVAAEQAHRSLAEAILRRHALHNDIFAPVTALAQSRQEAVELAVLVQGSQRRRLLLPYEPYAMHELAAGLIHVQDIQIGAHALADREAGRIILRRIVEMLRLRTHEIDAGQMIIVVALLDMLIFALDEIVGVAALLAQQAYIGPAHRLYWPREASLDELAPEVAQIIILLLRLDPHGDDAQSRQLRILHERAQQGWHIRLDAELVHDALVELDRIDLEIVDMRDRGIITAEAIDDDRMAGPVQAAYILPHHVPRHAAPVRLPDFEAQELRPRAALLTDSDDLVHKGRISKITRRYIDRRRRDGPAAVAQELIIRKSLTQGIEIQLR